MAAVFSLGLSGYILRRLPETGAKFLDGERTKGELLVPEMGSAFSPDHRKIRCFEAYTYVYIYIYISMSTEKRLWRPHTNFNASRYDTSVHTMKPAPALHSIKLRWKCRANGLREPTFNGTWRYLFSNLSNEFIITSEIDRPKNKIFHSFTIRSWKIVCRSSRDRLLLQTVSKGIVQQLYTRLEIFVKDIYTRDVTDVSLLDLIPFLLPTRPINSKVSPPTRPSLCQ